MRVRAQDKGGCAIVSAVRASTTLIALNLRNNKLGQATGEALVDCMQVRFASARAARRGAGVPVRVSMHAGERETDGRTCVCVCMYV